jgi:RNA polymerase sigma-70 factor (ECF subfamily)
MFNRLRRLEPADSASDTDLHRAVRQGNGEAMAALYRRHGPLVYRFTLRMSQDNAIAEEVTQEVFLALLGASDRFDPKRSALSTWLCGIARRQLWKHLERSQRYVQIEPEDESFDAESADDDPAINLSRKEAVAAVRQGIDELPALLKEVIVLCELEEMTYEQVAIVLAIPVGTVRSRLHRAKARLAPLLLDSHVSTAQVSLHPANARSVSLTQTAVAPEAANTVAVRLAAIRPAANRKDQSR